MQIVKAGLGDPKVIPLLDGLRQEYEARYGPGDGMGDVAADYEPPLGVFLVLMDDEGTTVAGGGIHRFDEATAEIKRVWTHPDHRRKGHAIRILAELEDAARQLGYRKIRLETGPAQPEALALYRRLGFQEIGNYGKYENAMGFERMLRAEPTTLG